MCCETEVEWDLFVCIEFFGENVSPIVLNEHTSIPVGVDIETFTKNRK
jgi:hypothetical protein